MDFLICPCRWINDARVSVLHQNSGENGKSILSALKISLRLGKSLGHRVWISRFLQSFGGRVPKREEGKL